jgi:hypothetical protein
MGEIDINGPTKTVQAALWFDNPPWTKLQAPGFASEIATFLLE